MKKNFNIVVIVLIILFSFLFVDNIVYASEVVETKFVSKDYVIDSIINSQEKADLMERPVENIYYLQKVISKDVGLGSLELNVIAEIWYKGSFRQINSIVVARSSFKSIYDFEWQQINLAVLNESYPVLELDIFLRASGTFEYDSKDVSFEEKLNEYKWEETFSLSEEKSRYIKVLDIKTNINLYI